MQSEEIESPSQLSLKEIYYSDYFHFHKTESKNPLEIDILSENEEIEDEFSILIVDDNVFNLLVLEN